MKILFVGIESLHYYVGDTEDDKPVPACGYNFQYVNGKYYGEIDQCDEIKIENIEGVSETDNAAEETIVVWATKDAEDNYNIAGWYKHATVYRNQQRLLTLDSERVELDYHVVVDAKHGILLPLEERRFFLPKGKEGVWFEEDKAEAAHIASYMHNYAGEKINQFVTKESIEREAVISFNDYEQYLIKADEFQNKGLYDRAIRCCNKAIQEEPEITVAYECKGSILLSLKMYDEAKEVYKKLLELEEDNGMLHYCMGLCYGLTYEYEKALEHMNIYLAEEQNDASAIADQGVILYNLGQSTKAVEAFEKAANMEAENEFFQGLLAYTK